MKVQIENDLYLESDELQFTLKRYTGKFSEKGAELYNNLGYYSTIRGAMLALMKMEIKRSTADDLQGLIADIARIEQRINDTFTVNVNGRKEAV